MLFASWIRRPAGKHSLGRNELSRFEFALPQREIQVDGVRFFPWGKLASFYLHPSTGVAVGFEGTVAEPAAQPEDSNFAERMCREYLKSGPTAFDEWRGAFGCIIWDPRSQTLTAVSGAGGFYPLFVREEYDEVAIGSEPDTLRKMRSAREMFDAEALDEYMTCGMVLSDRTLYREVTRLPKDVARVFTVESHRDWYHAEAGRYVEMTGSFADKVEEIYETLKQAALAYVNNHGIRQVYLTGGTDSRVLLSFFDRAMLDEIEFVTYCAPSWAANDADYQIAAMLARRHGLKHVLGTLGFKNENRAPMTAKLGNIHALPQPRLGGSFGTESNSGFLFQVMPTNEIFQRPDYVRKARTVYWSAGTPDPVSKAMRMRRETPAACQDFAFAFERVTRSSLSTLHSAYATETYIEPYRIATVDKALPFLDHAYVQRLSALSYDELNNYRIYQELFLGRLRDWIQTPFNSDAVDRLTFLPKVEIQTPSRGNFTSFPYEKFAYDHAELLESMPGFRKGGVRQALAWGNPEFAIRCCDFLYWWKDRVAWDPPKLKYDPSLPKPAGGIARQPGAHDPSGIFQGSEA